MDCPLVSLSLSMSSALCAETANPDWRLGPELWAFCQCLQCVILSLSVFLWAPCQTPGWISCRSPSWITRSNLSSAVWNWQEILRILQTLPKLKALLVHFQVCSELAEVRVIVVPFTASCRIAMWFLDCQVLFLKNHRVRSKGCLILLPVWLALEEPSVL